jgi:hypothetical protein
MITVKILMKLNELTSVEGQNTTPNMAPYHLRKQQMLEGLSDHLSPLSPEVAIEELSGL